MTRNKTRKNNHNNGSDKSRGEGRDRFLFSSVSGSSLYADELADVSSEIAAEEDGNTHATMRVEHGEQGQ